MEIKLYQTRLGKKPFAVWYKKIKDQKVRFKINLRLNRLEIGDYGDCRAISPKLYELSIHFGAGYRIYFAKLNEQGLILLFLGGNKNSQEKDIKKAKTHLNDFYRRFKHG